MDDEAQSHLPAARRFAKDRADVEDAETAHFDEVLQHLGTAAFEHVRSDARELDDVVGDEPVAAGDQFEREFGFAGAGAAGDEHADTEHVHEHAMQRNLLGQLARQEEP